jgi:hypothetical protein
LQQIPALIPVMLERYKKAIKYEGAYQYLSFHMIANQLDNEIIEKCIKGDGVEFGGEQMKNAKAKQLAEDGLCSKCETNQAYDEHLCEYCMHEDNDDDVEYF